VVHFNLCGETACGGRDLGDGHQRTNVEHLGASEDEHRAPLAADLGQPHLTPVHSSAQFSASVQNSSTFSGLFRYAARSACTKAARTAAATPSRAAAEMLTPRRRACSASESSRVNVVRVAPTATMLAGYAINSRHLCVTYRRIVGAGRRTDCPIWRAEAGCCGSHER